MSEKTQGPATRTRSRKSGDKSGGTKSKSEKIKPDKGKEIKVSTKTQFTTGQNQRLVSAYLLPTPNCKTDQDQILKKRSASGTLYHTSVNFKTNMADIEDTEVTTSSAGNYDTCDSQDNTTDTLFEGLHPSVKQMSRQSVNALPNAINTCNQIPTAGSTYTAMTTQTVIVPTQTSCLAVTSNTCMSTITTPFIQTGSNATASLYSNPTVLKQSTLGQHFKLQMGTGAIVQEIPQYTFAMPQPINSSSINLVTPTETPRRNHQQTSMVDILQAINEKLNTIQTDVKSLKDSKQEFSEQITSIQYDLEDHEEEISQQHTNIRACHDKMSLLLFRT